MERDKHAQRNTDQRRNKGGEKCQFKRCRHFLCEKLSHRCALPQRSTELAVKRIYNKRPVLFPQRFIQAETLPQSNPIRLSRFLTEHLGNRISDKLKKQECDQRYDKHNDDGLEQTFQYES